MSQQPPSLHTLLRLGHSAVRSDTHCIVHEAADAGAEAAARALATSLLQLHPHSEPFVPITGQQFLDARSEAAASTARIPMVVGRCDAVLAVLGWSGALKDKRSSAECAHVDWVVSTQVIAGLESASATGLLFLGAESARARNLLAAVLWFSKEILACDISALFGPQPQSPTTVEVVVTPAGDSATSSASAPRRRGRSPTPNASLSIEQLHVSHSFPASVRASVDGEEAVVKYVDQLELLLNGENSQVALDLSRAVKDDAAVVEEGEEEKKEKDAVAAPQPEPQAVIIGVDRDADADAELASMLTASSVSILTVEPPTPVQATTASAAASGSDGTSSSGDLAAPTVYSVSISSPPNVASFSPSDLLSSPSAYYDVGNGRSPSPSPSPGPSPSPSPSNLPSVLDPNFIPARHTPYQPLHHAPSAHAPASAASSSGAPFKPMIAVDLDEVLGEFIPPLVGFYNATYGPLGAKLLSVRDFTSYHFASVWGGSDEAAQEKVLAFFQSAWFKDIPVIAGAREALQALSHRFQFTIVTSRQHMIEANTRHWIEAHYPGIFSALYFGNHYGSAGSGIVKSKPEMCASVHAVALIDDSLVYAKQCSHTLQKVFLFDRDGQYRWNELPAGESLPENVTRCFSWEIIRQQLENWTPEDVQQGFEPE